MTETELIEYALRVLDTGTRLGAITIIDEAFQGHPEDDECILDLVALAACRPYSAMALAQPVSATVKARVTDLGTAGSGS